jgi:cytochrome P450
MKSKPTRPAERVKADHPTGFELTPFDPEFRADPYPALAKVRMTEPVHFDAELSRWFVADFPSVREVLRSKDVSNNSHKADPQSYSGRIAANAAKTGVGSPIRSMLFMDDPEHRRLRNLVAKPFSAKSVEALRPRIRAIAGELLDAVTGPQFDLIGAFATPLPVIVIADLLGLEPSHRLEFKRWSDAIVGGFFNPLNDADKLADASRAQAEFNAYFLQVIGERRREPRDDLISAMVTAQDDAVPLSDAEILSQSALLLVAGNVTTTDLIGNGVKALLDHPAQLTLLRNQPELIGNAVEEILRYDSPVLQATRIFPWDTTIGGCPVRAGQSATVVLAAANRDPALNSDPDRFDIRRERTQHFSFGGGVHLCLGAWLARLEAQEAISVLLARMPLLKIVPRPLRYRAVPVFRGLEELWMQRGGDPDAG